MEVVVRSDDAVTLHVTRLRETRGPGGTVSRVFELDESVPALVEPTRQEHARHGGKTIVYWQARAGGEVHRAVTNAPEEARSIGEAVDRHLAAHLEEARRAVWESPRLDATYVLVFANRLSGESVMLVDHAKTAWLDVFHAFPALREAIERHRAGHDWFPVVVLAVRYGGVRWLPMRVGLDETTRPADVDETPRGKHLRVVER
jgi:hypothetical protein